MHINNSQNLRELRNSHYSWVGNIPDSSIHTLTKTPYYIYLCVGGYVCVCKTQDIIPFYAIS